MTKYLFSLFLLTLISLSFSACTKRDIKNTTVPTESSEPSPQSHDDVETLYNQGMDYYQQNDFEQAAQKFRQAAELNHAGAQFHLAALYRFGSGVPKDLERAIEWYRKAAEQDHVDAQLSLGMMYYKGIEIPQDFEEAEKWLSLAAELGNQDAIDVLEEVRSMLVK